MPKEPAAVSHPTAPASLQTMLFWDPSYPLPTLQASKLPFNGNNRWNQVLLHFTTQHLGPWTTCAMPAFQPQGWIAVTTMGEFVPRCPRLPHPLSSAARDECSTSWHQSTLGLGTTGNVVTPAILPCTFGRFSLKSGQALHVVLEVANVWFDILLTWSVFRCGFEHRPHKCSCLYGMLFFWE